MEITVNGERREIASPLNVSQLLKVLKLESQPVIVELNLEIVSHSDMEKVSVCEGDTVEIIRLVAGG